MFWQTIVSGFLGTYLNNAGSKFKDQIGEDAFKALTSDIAKAVTGSGAAGSDDVKVLKVEGLADVDALIALRSSFIRGSGNDGERYIPDDLRDQIKPFVLRAIEKMKVTGEVTVDNKKVKISTDASPLTKALYLAKAREGNVLTPEDVRKRIQKLVKQGAL